MVLKKVKPISNSSRGTVLIDYRRTLVPSENKAPRSLLKRIKEKAGRSSHTGRIDIRHRSGWHKKVYRIIDFKRYKNDNVVGKIKSIEYDPNRNSFISLVSYLNGSYSYIISPDGIKVGDTVMSGEGDNVPISTGNNVPLFRIPSNTFIHNLEIKPKQGGILLRSAGSFGEVIGEDEDKKYVKVKLRSKEIRRVLGICRATIGKVGNNESNLTTLGKAGRTRWRGIRPTVRGSAMNPCDHPHGGGEGKAGIGRSSPMDPWGNKTLGKKTRRKNKPSDKYIVQSRSWSKKR